MEYYFTIYVIHQVRNINRKENKRSLHLMQGFLAKHNHPRTSAPYLHPYSHIKFPSVFGFPKVKKRKYFRDQHNQEEHYGAINSNYKRELC